MCAIQDRTGVVVVILYRSVPRNPVRFMALQATIVVNAGYGAILIF